MKFCKALIIGLIAAFGIVTGAEAQQTQAGIQNQINTTITTNGHEEITGALLNSVLSNMNVAIFQGITNIICNTSATRNSCISVLGYANSKWFGAVCDGSANDTTAIHAFIAATFATGVVGFIQPGTCVTDDFNFTSLPYLRAPTPVIHGSGINGTYIKWSSGHTASQVFSTIGIGTYQEGLTWTDLTIVGNSSGNVGGGDCVVIDTMYLVAFQNVGVIDCPEHGINVHGESGKYFGGLNMQGGQVLNWGQNAGSTSSGLKVGPLLYDISISDGTEFAGGPTTSIACIEVNSPSNGVRLFDLNIDCGSVHSQVLITNATGPTETWTQLVGNFVHGAAGSVGVTISNSREVMLSGMMFLNGTADDIHITGSDTISVVGGTANSVTTRAQSIQLSGSTTGVSVTGMSLAGTFSTNAIVEDAGGPDYNTFVGNTGPAGIGVTLTGTHSSGGVRCPSGVTAGTVTVLNGIVTHC